MLGPALLFLGIERWIGHGFEALQSAAESKVEPGEWSSM